MTKGALGFLLAATLTLLVACGEVVTPQPTARVTPTATSPPARTPPRPPPATAPITPPPPTATPTITPTPVTHVVKSGETLLSIAFDYGVSLQALQTVNGIEDARFLQVGQELIIPSGEEEPGSAPNLLLPTPTPLPFSLRGVSYYETPVGSLWCLGEIVNTTEFPLANVQIRVVLFNAAGEPLAEANAFAAADLIPPGERSPFGILFTDPPSDWANPQVTVVRGQEAGTLADDYVPIQVSEVEGQPSETQFRATGTVRNASQEQTAAKVSVIVTTYDAEGAVTGFRHGTVGGGEPLAPGATAPFDLLTTYHGNPPRDFSVIAVGRVPTE